VITEDDYIEYLTRTDISSFIPVTLAAKLRRSHFLFLGYRLRDWNLRVILHRLWGGQRLTYRSWAVLVDADPVEEEYWVRRNVDLVDVPLEEYVAHLSDHVRAIGAAKGT
jgi:SIR2-like protein